MSNDELQQRIRDAANVNALNEERRREQEAAVEALLKERRANAETLRSKVAARMKELRDQNPSTFQYSGEALAGFNAKEYRLIWQSPRPRRALSVTVDLVEGRITSVWLDDSGRSFGERVTDPEVFDLESLLLDLADQGAWSSR